MENTQQYCISARNRISGYTEDITGPMSQKDAKNWMCTGQKFAKTAHKYFRISKHPFKRHKKG